MGPRKQWSTVLALVSSLGLLACSSAEVAPTAGEPAPAGRSVSAVSTPSSSLRAGDDVVDVHRFEEPELMPIFPDGSRGPTLLSNDLCWDGVTYSGCAEGRLQIVAYQQPTHGLVRPVYQWDANGVLTSVVVNLEYLGRGGYVGDDVFQYTVQDTVTGDTGTAAVTVHVSWTGTEQYFPQLQDDDVTVERCDLDPCPVLALRPLDNDILLESCGGLNPLPQCDGGPYRFSAVMEVDATLTQGVVTRADAEPQVVFYQPKKDFVGIDEFTYAVGNRCSYDMEGVALSCQETGLDVGFRGAIVRVRVKAPNRAPVASNSSVTLEQGSSAVATLLATDPDGDALTYRVATAPAHGTVTLNGNVATYTPAASYYGSDSFTFLANDGVLDSNPAAVAVTVTASARNHPPVCTAARPSVTRIWPPNHREVPLSILGVTDADGDAVTITITGIRQDEPTNANGDGNTCVDGGGVGTSRPWVRAERKGDGNGRVYELAFRADDGRGGSCTGTVQVGVPHDCGGAEGGDEDRDGGDDDRPSYCNHDHHSDGRRTCSHDHNRDDRPSYCTHDHRSDGSRRCTHDHNRDDRPSYCTHDHHSDGSRGCTHEHDRDDRPSYCRHDHRGDGSHGCSHDHNRDDRPSYCSHDHRSDGRRTCGHDHNRDDHPSYCTHDHHSDGPRGCTHDHERDDDRSAQCRAPVDSGVRYDSTVCGSSQSCSERGPSSERAPSSEGAH